MRKISYIATFAVIIGGRARLGHGSVVGFLVVDGCQSVRVVGGIAGWAEIGAHPDGRGGWTCSRYDDIGTLPDTKSDHLSNIWLNGHKVVSNDCHVKAINRETLNTLRAAVDKPESVLLAGLELEFRKAGIRCALLGFVLKLGAVEAHLAIDQVAVRERR